MALNIKSTDVERLATEVATLTHETKTEAIRRALIERRDRLQARGMKTTAHEDLTTYLEKNVWPLVPDHELGRLMTREEEDQILGFGPEGY